MSPFIALYLQGFLYLVCQARQAVAVFRSDTLDNPFDGLMISTGSLFYEV